MKKILLLCLIPLVLVFTVSVTYAYDQTTQTQDSIEDTFVWDEAAANGYSYAITNRILIDFVSIYVEMTTTLMGAYNGTVQTPDWENFIIPNAGAYSSRIEIYDTAESAVPLDSWFVTYEAPGVTEIMFSNNGEGIWDIDTSNYTDKYIQIVLMLNTDTKPLDFYYTVPTRMNDFPGSWDFNVDVVRDIMQDVTIADLPITAGNPYQTGMTGDVYGWEYQESTNTFVANVTYYNDYPIAINNVSFGDQAFLDKVESVDYYTVDGDRYFQFNFLNNENVLLTGTGQFAQAWNGFALWNLTTNELIVYNKALALTYLDITEDREIFAYLYLPGIPMDDVLAVSGHFNYRYGYENFLGTQKYEEWQTSLFALEKDRESYGTQSIFEGALPQWSYDAAEYSLAALAVGSVLSMIPGLQVIGVPLLFASAALMVSSVATAIEHVTTGLISEIETITPSTTLKTTLNNHYTLASGALTVLPSNATVEKLFLGLYTKPGTNCVEPDADTLVYTEITWVTNGQVYTLDENYIDSGAVLDVDDQAALPVEGTNTLDDFFASLGEYGIYFIILAVIVVGALVLKYLDSGLTSLSRITKDKRKLFFFALIIATILIILGVIRL